MSVRGMTYFEQHFFYSSKLLRLLVDHRPQNQRKFNFRWILFPMTIIYVCPMIMHQGYQLYKSEVTLQSAVKELQNMIAAICILFLYSGYQLKSVQLQHSFVHIKVDYEKFFDDEELEILEKFTKQSKIYTYGLIAIFHLYYILMLSPSFINIGLYFFTTLKNVQLKLPVHINDISSSGPVYYSILIYQSIAIYIVTFIACQCFTIYFVLILHIFCQFSLISMKIGQPFRKNKDHVQDTSFNNEFHDEFNWIKDIIDRHSRIREFVNHINSFSKEMYLIGVIIAMTLIILDFLNMFQLSIWQNKSELLECIFYIIGSILVTYMAFHAGQELINYSTEVFKELCNVPFYTLSIKTQKLLLFMITRNIKPCNLLIGDFFVSSHEVFSSLIQKAFSFATVYYSVRQH